MKKIWVYIFIAAFMPGSCTAPVSMIRTMPVRSNDSLALSGYVYSLPMTTLKIEAEIVMTRTIRGPYYRFAEKYMGIRNVPQESSIEWDIGAIRLETITESDPQSYFSIRKVSGQPDLSGFLRLRDEGLVVDVNLPGMMPSALYTPEETPGPMYFKDVSVKSHVLLSSDTLYKTILTDSTFIKVPVLRDQVIVRTIDEKAQEAAHLIFKLRKRRFHMISANYDIMPEGVAMEHALRELDELEAEYLSLFIGKEYKSHETLTLYYTPEPYWEPGPVELFRFSGNNGIVSSTTSDSERISLTIVPEGKTEILKDPGMPGSGISNALYYRVPDMAGVTLHRGTKILIQDRIPVCQYGAVLSLPLMMGE